MKTHHISFTYKKTKNLGNFESLSAELTCMMHIDEDEDPDDCIAFLQSNVRESVIDFLNSEDPGSDQYAKRNVKSVHKISGVEVI